MTDSSYVVSVHLLVPSSPERVFEFLVDPQRHVELDGSGTVRRVRASTLPLGVGDHFDMYMHRGFSYSTRNTGQAVKPGRLIRWSTRPLTFPLSLLIGGRTWTYELDEQQGGTRVTETWDLRPERNRRVVRWLAGTPAEDMRRTLVRLARRP